MRLKQHDLLGVYDVFFDTNEDMRGGMERLYVDDCTQELAGHQWKQILISKTKKINTVRGLYIQSSPHEEAKLIRVLTGSMFWVAVDLRPSSHTFGKWSSCILSHEKSHGMYIERGFAHGCLSLADNTNVLLMADNIHQPNKSHGINWKDKEIGIQWPQLDNELVISPAHKLYTSFNEYRK